MASKKKPAASSAPESTTKSVGHGIEEFRAQYDRSYRIPRKIREALQRLGDRWLREIDFAKFAGVGSVDISAYRGEFEADYVVELTGGNNGKRVWAGTKALARKLRELQQ